MNVTIVSTSDIGHGAGVAAYRLHLCLRKLGINSNMLVSEKLSTDKHTHQVGGQKYSAKFSRLHQNIELLLNSIGPQNVYAGIARWLWRHPLIKDADVIHLHNIHWHRCNFPLIMLGQLRKIAPIIWTLHDMWPLTGHCIYPFGCEKWKTGCGQCPDLNSYMSLKLDTTRLSWKIKQFIYPKPSMTVIAPSLWLHRLASESPLFNGCNMLNIPYGINQNIFKPFDKNRARGLLGIHPSRKKVVLFVSGCLQDLRKGFRYFEEALHLLRNQLSDMLVLIVGKGEIPPSLKRLFEVLPVGYVVNEERMAQIYSAADICVVPSTMDNLPNVVLESMACGIPVVGFRTGGIPDVVSHMENGFTAATGNTTELAEGIAKLLHDAELRRVFSDRSVRRIRNHFSEEIQVRRYLNIYEQVARDYKYRGFFK